MDLLVQITLHLYFEHVKTLGNFTEALCEVVKTMLCQVTMINLQTYVLPTVLETV